MPIVLESNQNHATVCDTEVCTTLPASMGMGGGYVPMIVDKKQKTVCFDFDPGASRDVGVLFLEEVSKTISNGTCPGHHNGVVLRKDVGEMQEDVETYVAETIAAVDCRNGSENEKVNGTLQAKEQGQNLNSNNVCRSGSVVRRLTPMECERLQGFPDGWTDIGEWVDSKGKKHKEADSPRYKALGNSIALPFWQWMAKRISAQYERTPTMASLFDGIGGFPLVFSRAGVVPVWASEIEEFPMAVTKLRFPEE